MRRTMMLAAAAILLAAASQAGAATPEAQRNNAAKIAGLVGFVNVSCPDLRSDQERFKAVLAGFGVTSEELDQGELMVRARSYVEAYRKDVPASCKRAVELFGRNGSVVPDLILPR